MTDVSTRMFLSRYDSCTMERHGWRIRPSSEVSSNYERHCRSAREIAETYFDARRTVRRILEVALP
jgi:hypothetical protein